jgi:acyl carrier protein
VPRKPWSAYANWPLQAQFSQRLGPRLRRRAAARLPEHMVPATFVVLEDLPRTPSGKVDRRALPSPDRDRPALEGAYVAPRTGDEEAMARLWADLMGLDQIGVEDNFFTELGGHSLLGTQLVSHIREAFGVELPLRTLFERPTVAGLSAAVAALRGAGADAGQAPIPRVERGGDADDVEQLSEEQVDALLERMLAGEA